MLKLYMHKIESQYKQWYWIALEIRYKMNNCYYNRILYGHLYGQQNRALD
jgi:hypothetical protein